MAKKARSSRQKYRLKTGPKATDVKVQAQQAATTPPPKKPTLAPLLEKDVQFARERQTVRELKRVGVLGAILLTVMVVIALLWR
jgi:hypothetical protein